jgi:hypothetical protein
LFVYLAPFLALIKPLTNSFLPSPPNPLHIRIQNVWDAAEPHISFPDYCIDFAVTPDLTRCYIVEINAALPPLSGTHTIPCNATS